MFFTPFPILLSVSWDLLIVPLKRKKERKTMLFGYKVIRKSFEVFFSCLSFILEQFIFFFLKKMLWKTILVQLFFLVFQASGEHPLAKAIVAYARHFHFLDDSATKATPLSESSEVERKSIPTPDPTV